MTSSRPSIDLQPRRDVEVLGFVGTIDACTRLLGRRPAAPLAFLDEVKAALETPPAAG